MAAADRFWVNITGRGGHAAMPHLSIDPVVAASQVCTSCYVLFPILYTISCLCIRSAQCREAHT